MKVISKNQVRAWFKNNRHLIITFKGLHKATQKNCKTDFDNIWDVNSSNNKGTNIVVTSELG